MSARTRRYGFSVLVCYFLVGSTCFFLALGSLQAQTTLYWNAPNGGNGTWDTTSTMWKNAWTAPPDTVWNNTNNDSGVFRGGVTGNITVDAGGISVNDIIIGATGETANAYTFSGGQITLSGTSPNVIGVTDATDTVTINSIIAGTNLFFNNTTGSAAGGTSMGAGNLIITSNNNTTLSGTVNIGGYNQGGGALRITNSNALGTGTVEINGNVTCTARLELDGSGGGLSLGNSIIMHGRGTNQSHNNLAPEIVNYAGNNSITVDISFSTGGDDYVIQSDAGTLTLNTITNGLGGTRNLYLQGASNGGVTGAISGSSGTASNLIKSGSGTWTLSGANTYNGTTTVNAGALRITNSSALPSTTAAVNVSGGTNTGRIELDGSTSALTIGRDITLQGRSTATDAHLANYAGTNTITGNLLLVQGGTNYLIQANSGSLTLGNIQNNSTVTGTRLVNLQGNGTVSGVIGGGTASSPNDISIIKGGTGTWTLSGANTYTGATTINGGTLALKSTGSIASSSIQVNSGAYFDVTDFSSGYTLSGTQKLMGTGGTVIGDVINGAASAIAPGTDGAIGTLNLQGNLILGMVSGGKLKYDLAINNTPANNDLLAITGNLSILGSPGYTQLAINMLDGQLGTGSYKLITYTGSLSGSVDNISLGPLSSSGTTRQSFSLSSAVTNEIDLIVSGTPGNIVWKGNLSNVWDRSPTGVQNWLNGAVADKFYDLDSVTFNATGAAQPTVNITGDWTPGFVTVDAATNYTFTGAGSLSGSPLTKSGTGTLTIQNTGANSFTSTTINGGVLQIGDGATAGAGSIGTGAIVNNASLVLNRPDDLNIAGGISGTGSLEKKGAGVATLGGTNSYQGLTTITAGTLKAGSGTALGAAANGTTIANGATLDVNGMNLTAEAVTVQGAGVGGSGAILSTAAGDQQNALSYVTLSGNTTFGGTGRWDIRGTGAYLSGNYNLTKTGTNLIALVGLGATDLKDITIESGSLLFETTTTMGDSSNTVTVAYDATLGFYNTGTNILYKNLILQGGTMGTPATVATNPGTSNFGGPVTLDGGGTINVINGGTVIISGNIGGTGGLIKTGADTAILTGTVNNWEGGATIDDGTLQIGDGGANGSLPATGTIATNGTTGSGILSFNTASNITVSNDISGTGRLWVRNGTGIVTLTGNNTYDGSSSTETTTLIGTSNVSSGGILRAASNTALGTANVSISGGASNSRLELSGGISLYNYSINIEGRQYMGGYNLQEPSVLPHILNVSGDNSLTGDITFNVWGVNYVIQSDSGKLTLNTISYNLSSTSDRYLRLRGVGNGEVQGAIGGSASGPIYVYKEGSGTWTLSGYNDISGAITVAEGTLALGPYAFVGGTPLIDVKAGATYDVSAYYGYTLYSDQTLSGSGTVVGEATTGVTADSGSTIVPGDSVGTLTFTNDLTLNGGGKLVYELTADTTPGSGVNDLISVGGTLILASGATDVEIHPLALSLGTYRLIESTGKSGTGAFNLVNNMTRYTMSIDNTPTNQVNLIVTDGAAKALTWTGAWGSTWDVINLSNWTDGSIDEQYYDADQVTFDASGSTNTVQIDTTVYPGSVTVDGSANYTFQGSGKISGLTGLTKKGTGTLTISNANDYTGQTKIEDGVLLIDATGSIGNNSAVLITGGTLQVGNIRALGDIVDWTLPGTTINGGTLDVNGQNIGAEAVTVQGSGVGDNGAIINSAGSQQNALRKVTLSGDAYFGGTGRWDIRTDNPASMPASLTGNNFNLTKVGSNTVYLVNLGDTGLGDIFINSGTLGFQGSTTLGNSSKTITVATNATLDLYAIDTSNILSKNFAFSDGSYLANGGGIGAALAGDSSLGGNLTITTNNSITLTGDMTGTGGITKAGAMTLTLAGTQNYAGATTVNAGTMSLSGTGTIGDVVNSATFRLLDGTHTVADISGTGTTVLEAGAVLNADSVVQGTLTIGAGAKLTIAAITGDGPLAGVALLSPVPEPSTWALLMLAGLGLGIYWRRRR
jgi:fibronectin-binding autotransporter adhesin